MKIHLRANHVNAGHTNFTIFVNGGNAGTVTMRRDEAANFHQIVAMGCKQPIDEFVSTGKWEATNERTSV